MTDNSPQPGDETDGLDEKERLLDLGLVVRPQVQLHDLPHQLRWEYTRRHPYYLFLWRLAAAYRTGTEEVDPEDGLAAFNLLSMIGVTGTPVSPELSFEELDALPLDPAFQSGAVQPMTLRAMAAVLINALPASEQAMLGSLLLNAGLDEYAVEGDEDRSLQKQKAYVQLNQLASAALDSYPVAPLFYIHMEASQRQIMADLQRLVQQWKERRAIAERRVHSGKLDEYLQVWDLREGWRDGQYEIEDEHSFHQIAVDLGANKSTVVNKYRSAFKLLTGHEFSPDLWFRTMAMVKFSDLSKDPAGTLTRRYRRLIGSQVPRPVAESQVTKEPIEQGEVGIVEAMSTVVDDQAALDLHLDLLDLFRRGFTNEQIAEELELSSAAVVQHLRERMDELNGL